jgi:hypothetical protein
MPGAGSTFPQPTMFNQETAFPGAVPIESAQFPFGTPAGTSATGSFVDPSGGSRPPLAFNPQPSTEVPFVVQPPNPAATSMARRVRKRARKKGGLMVPLTFGGLLVAGIAAYLWFSRPTLSGALKAQSLGENKLEEFLTPNMTQGVSKETYLAVRNTLSEFPLEINSDLMSSEFRGTSKGIQFTLTAGEKTELFRVPYDHRPYLREYCAEHQDELLGPLNDELSAAAKRFFETIDQDGIRLEMPVKSSFRDEVGVNMLLKGGLGYNVAARVDNVLYRCVSESDGALFFLLPKGTKHFTVEPRPLRDKPSPLPVEFQYDVTVVSG